MSGSTVSKCIECERTINERFNWLGGVYFCSAICKRECERREAREEADARAPYEGFDEDWTDGGRRSDAEGRL